jgi:hypothetical protein
MMWHEETMWTVLYREACGQWSMKQHSGADSVTVQP